MLEIDSGYEKTKTAYNKPMFLTFDLGQHRVRLLTSPKKIWTHYLRDKGLTIECLGSDCPICQNNKILKLQYEDAKKAPGYNSPSLRHYFNCLDRTLVKVCPKCQTENKIKLGEADFPAACRAKDCGTILLQVVPLPSNKVKVINVSDTNAQQLELMQTTVVDEKKEPRGLENFDVIFTALMAGDKKSIYPQPDVMATDKVEVPQDALYDLNKIVLHLEPEEINTLMKGVSLRDIMLARRGETVEKVSDEIATEATNALHELFG